MNRRVGGHDVEAGPPTLGVGQLIAGLGALLDDQVGRVRVVGEISNLHRAASGHVYFTLKDSAGQMRAALFRGNASRVRFNLEEGLEVVCEAEVSVYAARGDLQLIVRGVTPNGVGALQLAFEQMRKRLAAAGLFDEDRKQEIPTYPRRIGVVASPTSAAIRDVLKVAGRRFPAIPILISPTLVQGDEAPEQIAKAIERLHQVSDIDVMLVVRGGGSIEDLWAFNTEVVAKAMAQASIPIICGVGHETDVTIADLVADLRAPTPSAAAMQALPDRAALRHLVDRDFGRLVRTLERRLESAAQRVDGLQALLGARSPQARVSMARTRAHRATQSAEHAAKNRLSRERERLAGLAAHLDALSPLAVLGRGYALARTGPGGEIVRSARQLEPGSRIEVRFGEGEATAEVVRVDPGSDGA